MSSIHFYSRINTVLLQMYNYQIMRSAEARGGGGGGGAELILESVFKRGLI